MNLSPSTAQPKFIPLKPGTSPSDTSYLSDNVRFQVVSEDLGHPLIGIVLLDFKGLNSKENPTRVGIAFNVPAGNLNSPRDVERPLEFSLISPGCHSISVVVSHGFQPFGPFAVTPVEQGDVAIATWFYYLGVQPRDPAFAPCESAPLPPDAGSDASDGGGL
jgi:hypothetical protein